MKATKAATTMNRKYYIKILERDSTLNVVLVITGNDMDHGCMLNAKVSIDNDYND